MRRLGFLLTLLGLLLGPASASAATYLPPPGKLFHGVSAGPAAAFDREVGKHSPVVQEFVTWNGDLRWAIRNANRNRSRLMLHLSTFGGKGTREVISTSAIAAGAGDAFLVRMNRELAEHGAPVYVRLMAEMNGHWNPYSAFDADGSRRPGHTTADYRQAFRRTVLVLRGGDVGVIDAKLRALRLPPVRSSESVLPRPPVAFAWVPQTFGSPNTRANRPGAYWPGRRFVDWVGADFYSKFPNFSDLSRFYASRRWNRKPFLIGEWALWGADDTPFVRRLFAWTRAHKRVRMLMYNQGYRAGGVFRLSRYPNSRAEIARQLRSPRWAAWAPEW